MGKDFLIFVAFTKEGVSRKLMQIQRNFYINIIPLKRGDAYASPLQKLFLFSLTFFWLSDKSLNQ